MGMVGSDLGLSSDMLRVIELDEEGVDVTKVSVVFLLDRVTVSPTVSYFSFLLGFSGSGNTERLAAVLSALIQLFLIPWVTADSVYCLSSKVETMKP